MNYSCYNLNFVFGLLLAIITGSCNPVSEIGLRQKVNINNGWQYLEYDSKTVDEAENFLLGKHTEIKDNLQSNMLQASKN